jgi:glucose-1-phosphate adenylyltransferase
VDTTVLGLTKEQAQEMPYIASMGIYVFKKKVLLELLNKTYPRANDFGSEVIPNASKTMKVQAYLFNGYWEDIGTIKSFFDANLALAKDPARFEFYDAINPIYTSPRFLPPAKLMGCKVKDAILGQGVSMESCEVENAIIGLRSRIEAGVKIKDAMIIGADYYETAEQRAALLAAGKVPIGIGAGSIISNAIIDKNGRIGKNCVITNKSGIEEAAHEDEGYYIRSGIVCVLRNGTIKDGTVI